MFPSKLGRVKEYDEDNYYVLFDVCSYRCFINTLMQTYVTMIVI